MKKTRESQRGIFLVLSPCERGKIPIDNVEKIMGFSMDRNHVRVELWVEVRDDVRGPCVKKRKEKKRGGALRSVAC
jgi:hypothetical protein